MKDKNKDNLISSLSGITIGFLAGLIGIGGGEYRAPVLIYLLRLSVKFAITSNLLIGLLVVSASFIRRLDPSVISSVLLIAAIMGCFSVIGSWGSAKITKKLNDILLKRFLGLLLVIAAIKVLLDADKLLVLNLEINVVSISLAIIFGFLIGSLSGLTGIAGGEFRIPALLFIFGMPIKLAGTTNLLVSIPTVLAAFLKHKKLGHLDRRSMKISVLMGVFSIIGALIGASLVSYVSDRILLTVLSVFMLIVGIKMTWRP